MSRDPAVEDNDWLAGRGVLVTRPSAQADGLCQLIEAAGGRAIRFPVLAIEPLCSAPSLLRSARLADFDLAIFISANAVEQALQLVRPQDWPASVAVAVIGAATARAAAAHGLAVSLCPATAYNSEALLALPELQHIEGQRILILRGAGGREVLRERLQARGAQVEYLELYRRVRPRVDAAPLLQRWRGGDIAAVLVTSNESLQNLLAMIGTLGQTLLRTTPLIVASERTAECAAQAGLEGPLRVARDATDAAMLAALHEQFR